MLTPTIAGKSFDPLSVPRLPARLDVDQTARLLGFAAHDIPLLVRAKLLQPLGKPAPNAPKYFSSVAIEELHSNQNWLSAATKAVSQYWKTKRERLQQQTQPAGAATAF
jgi:hypothetical protein